MKIPETQANVGAYYGNEENGQWQPNGVIIDSGVGGGVVGSGDAGVHRAPVYPVHIPRGHIPSYVMAGAYYPPAFAPGPPPQDDFADYMWMENEDEFDKQVMQQLEEEALMEQCIEAMLEDEQRERRRPLPNGHNRCPTSSNGASISLEEAVSRSTLNPLAAEFVPSFGARQTFTEQKSEPVEVKTEETESKEESTTQSESVASPEEKEQSRTEEPAPAPADPPEVSAADVQPIDDKKAAKKDAKKQPEAKKPAKPEAKAKTKAAAARAEPKVAKKKDVRAGKSESDGADAAPPEDAAASPVEDSTPAFKPINYAAAARANKPKKPTTPPATDKTAPPPKLDAKPKVEKTEKKPLPKDKVKTDKPPAPQRKNSAK